MNNASPNTKKSNFAKNHPVISFLLITFAWTWLFWLAAIPFRSQNDLLVMSMVMVGGFGPALAGVVTLAWANGSKPDFSGKKMLTLGASALVIFAVMAWRYQLGNIADFQTLAQGLTLSMPILMLSAAACLVGGWVISSAVSRNSSVRAGMASILPTRLSLGWTLFAFFSFTGMILLSWGVSTLLGMPVEYPPIWGRSILEVGPIFLSVFLLTAFAQGGNEEPGWRGFLQPALQKRFNPLVAALIVSLFWSLWHLPLYLNGFYPGDLLQGMLGSGIYRILLAIFLAWVYNRSGNNIFLMVILHTTFNVMVNFLPVSDGILLILWLLVVIAIIIKDKMYRKLPENPLG